MFCMDVNLLSIYTATQCHLELQGVQISCGLLQIVHQQAIDKMYIVTSRLQIFQATCSSPFLYVAPPVGCQATINKRLTVPTLNRFCCKICLTSISNALTLLLDCHLNLYFNDNILCLHFKQILSLLRCAQLCTCLMMT